MKHTRTFCVFVVGAACSLMRGGSLHGQSADVDQDKAVKVKAAYLLNFAKFVTWPIGAFQDEHSPIIIGIAGVDPFGQVLDQTIKDKTVMGRKLEVRRFPWRGGGDVSAARQCHLLYVSTSLGDDAADLILALGRLPILFVGEGAQFAKMGGTLGFVMEEGRIVFWANKEAAETTKLVLSSQLLKLARPTEDATVAPVRKALQGKDGD